MFYFFIFYALNFEILETQRQRFFVMKNADYIPSAGSIFNDVTTKTLTKCASKCLALGECASFAYNNQSKNCKLASSAGNERPQISDGYRHYELI